MTVNLINEKSMVSNCSRNIDRTTIQGNRNFRLVYLMPRIRTFRYPSTGDKITNADSLTQTTINQVVRAAEALRFERTHR